MARVLGNTQAPGPALEPTVDETKTRTQLSHPFSKKNSSDSISPKTAEENQGAPRSFPDFRDLPFEPLKMVCSEVPAPCDTARLPVPEIVIIRATDSVDDLVHTPDASNPPDPLECVPGDIEAPLPDSLMQIEIPDADLLVDNLIRKSWEKCSC